MALPSLFFSVAQKMEHVLRPAQASKSAYENSRSPIPQAPSCEHLATCASALFLTCVHTHRHTCSSSFSDTYVHVHMHTLFC